MSEATIRGWLPADWLDECVPPPELDPTAFIRGPAGDKWRVASDDDDYDDDIWTLYVTPGETVRFMQLRKWPIITVTAGPDHTFEPRDAVPDGATLFWLPYDPDTVSTSMREMLIDQEIAEGERFDVECYDWSVEADFRLVVDAAGARFVKVEEGESDD